jgi:hypothetical protein
MNRGASLDHASKSGFNQLLNIIEHGGNDVLLNKSTSCIKEWVQSTPNANAQS